MNPSVAENYLASIEEYMPRLIANHKAGSVPWEDGCTDGRVAIWVTARGNRVELRTDEAAMGFVQALRLLVGEA